MPDPRGPRPPAPVPPADWPTSRSRLARPGRVLNAIAIYPEEVYRRPIIERHYAGNRYLLVSHPDGIGHVLQDNRSNYLKGPKAQRMKTPLMGQSVLTAEGVDWQRQRRILTPAFRHAAVMGFVPQFAAQADAQCARWERQPATEAVDMGHEMRRLALAMFGSAMLGREIEQLAHVPGAAARYLAGARRVEALITLGLPEGRGVLVDRLLAWVAMRRVRALAGTIMATPQKRPGAQPSLLDTLRQSQLEETGSRMSAREAAGQIVTLLIAGHATTAGTLIWVWYLLDLCPPVRERLHAELASVLGDRPPAAEDIPRLTYTRMVIDEAMRPYPNR